MCSNAREDILSGAAPAAGLGREEVESEDFCRWQLRGEKEWVKRKGPRTVPCGGPVLQMSDSNSGILK